jgi:hypothetical protein
MWLTFHVVARVVPEYDSVEICIIDILRNLLFTACNSTIYEKTTLDYDSAQGLRRP